MEMNMPRVVPHMVRFRMERSEKFVFLGLNPSRVTYYVTLGKVFDLFSLILCMRFLLLLHLVRLIHI